MIYLFDKDEKLIKIVKKEAIKTALQKFALTTEKYVSDRLTVEMKGLSKKEFDAVEYMAIQSIEDAHTFHYFYIAQKFSENLTTLIGVQSGIEELRKSVVLDKRPHNTFARPIIDELLAGTNWQARFVSETSQRSTNFYYISTFEALKKVCQVWNLEMQFFVEVNGNKIGARYIDFKQKIGEATGKRVVYGHNALQILQEVERTNLFTALIGRGKGEELSAPSEENTTGTYGRRITFEDVVWETKKGNPVDKPKGQKYVELPEMTKRYGIKNADGTMRAKVGFAVFEDEEDKNALIKRTYDELVRASRPQLTLKTSTVYLKGVKIGDTIRVVRHDKKLDYDTRIFEITFNRLNNESSDIKLGDRISESNEAKIQNIASQKADELISSSFNGLLKNLPDFLPSADGLNKNWYGANDPTKAHAGKVGINDIWFKPNPEHEGQTIMLRWTGEVWKEIIRSNSDQEIIDEISKRFENLNLSGVDEAKAKAEEALKKAGASAELADEAKNNALANIRDLNAFKTSVQEERENLSDELKRYSQEETESRITSLRESFGNRFVARSTYLENVEGTNRRFEALTRDNEAKLAEYKQGIDGRIATITSQVAGKVNEADFQRVKETAQLYERILGNTDNGIADNVARMALTNQLFQVEVAKNIGSDLNYLRNSNFSSEGKFWNVVGATNLGINYEHSLKNHGKSGVHFYGENVQREYYGFAQEIRFLGKVGEKVAISFELAREGSLEFSDIRFGLHFKKNNNILHQKWRTISLSEIKLKSYTRFEYVYEIPVEVDSLNVMFYGLNGKTTNIYLTDVKIEKNSKCTVWTANPQDITENIEATRTQMTLLSNSWSVKTLNGPGDVLGAINLNPDGSVKINEGLISVGEKTYIKDGVIKSSMIGNAQIGTAHIGEIDASKANIINISAKNIVTEGLTANIIKGGKLTSLNNVTDFDLQTGWLEMNGFGVGIKNQFPNRPLQYLVFGAGNINGVDASYTALLSNRNGLQAMDNTSAGMQIWNGRTGYRIQSAINMYGQRITFNQSAQGGLREVAIDTGAHSISGLDEIVLKGVYLSKVLDDIYDNFRNLDHDGNYKRGYYSRWR